VGDLADRWSWQDNYKNLVFFLRKDVKWHDGKPFTSKDVKFTFDMLREASDAPAKLRINPRKDWYANIEHIEAADPYTVVFRLKRPQPSLLMMLASGYTPVYAAHIPPAQYRTGCIGTGPFKLKEWRRGEFVEYVKNPDYFVKGRPYLDGLKYVVIVERGTRTAALQAGQLDVAFPGETGRTAMEQLKKAVPTMVFQPVAQNVSDNIIMNTKKPPFDNLKVRLAVSYAIDRKALISAVHQGGAVPGASQQPKPYGVWGLLDKDLVALPGYGKVEDMKAQARKLLAEAGYPNGVDVTWVLLNTTEYKLIAEALQSMLAEVGIRIKFDVVDPSQFVTFRRPPTRGDIMMARWGGRPDPLQAFQEVTGTGGSVNAGDAALPEIDELIDKARKLDPANPVRMTVLRQLARLTTEQVSHFGLMTRSNVYAYKPGCISGIPPYLPTGNDRINDLQLAANCK
jgi:peptide/nickel transport system substrate-binding protein